MADRRVVCRVYGSGVWHGIEFREAIVGGVYVGVAMVPEADVGWFEARDAFTVDPKPKSK